MKVIVLASGSKGNVTYVEYNNTKILIDLGMNLTYVENALKEHGTNLKDIDAVLITHTHTDHILGLKSFNKKYKGKVYLSDKMKKTIDIDNYILYESINTINEINVEIINTSHDIHSVGFIIKADCEMVYITDTGYIKETYYEKLYNKDLYIIESNHDIEMLMNGPYPYHLKRRIWSDKGHLSNDMSAEVLTNVIGPKTKHIVLAHISEHNNDEQIAYKTIKKAIKTKKIEITIAKQNEPLKAIIL